MDMTMSHKKSDKWESAINYEIVEIRPKLLANARMAPPASPEHIPYPSYLVKAHTVDTIIV